MNKHIPLMKPFVGNEELNAVKEVLESGYLTEGQKTQQFEEAFARYVGAKHAIATTSCTTALELALRVLEIGQGDEVIIPDFTFPATGDAVISVGAEPVLVDVDLKTYNISPSAVENAITEKTKCVIPVSLFGNPVDMDPFIDLKNKYGFSIIEDAACSAGAKINGKMVGTHADMTCFSFHPRKIITTGEGGMVTTNNDLFSDKANRIKKFGSININGKVKFLEHGTNFKLSDVLGAIGIVQLSRIKDIINDKIQKANNYNKLLKNTSIIELPQATAKSEHTFQSYVICFKKEGIRDNLLKYLKANSIEVQIGTYALHKEPCFEKVKKYGDLQNATNLYNNSLTLPSYHDLTYADQEYICDMIMDFIKKNEGDKT